MRRNTLATAAAWLAAPLAWAHEGHGLAGSHWHASDAFGWLLAAGVAALVFWLSGGGK